MRIEWSPDRKAVKIYGDHSPWPIIVKAELVSVFEGDYEALFHKYHELYRENALPYAGSESHPVSVLCWNRALENAERGEKFWEWGQKTEGNWQYTGFYYIEEGYAVFPELNERIRV